MKACPYCAEQIQDEAVICRFCQHSLATGAPTAAVVSAPAVRTWSPGVAAVLSFFVPGLGQLYKGHVALGLVLLVVTLVGYLLIVPGLIIHVCVIANAYTGKAKGEQQAMQAAALTPEQIATYRQEGNRSLVILVLLFAGLIGAAAILARLLG